MRRRKTLKNARFAFILRRCIPQCPQKFSVSMPLLPSVKASQCSAVWEPTNVVKHHAAAGHVTQIRKTGNQAVHCQNSPTKSTSQNRPSICASAWSPKWTIWKWSDTTLSFQAASTQSATNNVFCSKGKGAGMLWWQKCQSTCTKSNGHIHGNF